MSKRKVEVYEDLLPDGRCKYRMPYLDKLSGKKKTVSVIMDKQSASNYKLAKRHLEERLEKIFTEVQDNNMPLSRLQELYFCEKERNLKESTLKRNKASIKRICEWLGNDSLINNLSVSYIRKTLMEHSAENHTYNEYLTRFKGMLNWAYMNDYLEDRKVIDKLKALPDNKKLRIEDKYLEREELQKLLDNSQNVPLWHYVIHFMSLSGLRIGELIALLDSDVDQEYIHVNKTYSITTDKIDTPKTSASIREVYIRQELKALIKKIRSWIRENNFKNGVRSEYFICGSDGEHFDYYAFNKYLKELSERVLGRTITTHALRHTAASLLIADGVPLETVSRMLGHESSKITKEIYFHMTKTLREHDNELLENAKVL
jgi:integrase